MASYLISSVAYTVWRLSLYWVQRRRYSALCSADFRLQTWKEKCQGDFFATSSESTSPSGDKLSLVYLSITGRGGGGRVWLFKSKRKFILEIKSTTEFYRYIYSLLYIHLYFRLKLNNLNIFSHLLVIFRTPTLVKFPCQQFPFPLVFADSFSKDVFRELLTFSFNFFSPSTYPL